MNTKLLNIILGKNKSIYEFDSGKVGNITTIMTGVHGNELAGPNILTEFIDKIEIISGKVFFVFANLEAMKKLTRQVGKNMNRCFIKGVSGDTYEESRAKEIMKILDQSDFLLDVHNTINELNSIPFLISEYEEIGKFFDVRKIVSGFDKLHPGGSDSYMNSIGKMGLCLESGSIYDENSKVIAKNGILNFLKYTGNIDGEAEIYDSQEYIKFDFIYKNKTMNFRFVKDFKDFEQVKKGQIIGYDGEKEIISDRDGFIIFTYKPKNIGDEVFCLGRLVKNFDFFV